MIQVALPVNSKDVSKTVKPEHLVPWVPRSSWDGWFAISIFPPGSPVRWLKAHLFHRACKPGNHPLAAIEGLDEKSEMLITWATGEEVRVLQHEVDAQTLTGCSSPLRVALDGRFLLEGTAPHYTMTFDLPEDRTTVRFDFEAGWPIWWSRWGRLLHYVGQHSAVKVKLDQPGQIIETEGLGVMEHVCGISLPFDFTRMLPLHYHWDVLSFNTPGSPLDSAAGLSIGRKGQTLIKLRSAARFPGRPSEAMQGLSVRYIEVSRARGVDGKDFMVPVKWEGTLRSSRGSFVYTARALTPVAEIIPAGGMLGFDFQGQWEAPGEPPISWEGTGFTEYGDFSGRLVNLAPPA